ncbi:disulfide bond formation protein B [Fulvimarina sp. 2208YS6-2-32]|uniref:Disulfide bond formation protein B n=1 Tax=Fulvimarina uroteuthidis TaxID=3098149 RepID=A0ABU5I1R3_9HYPH|nr:disulfide bond formation protein B [Fulvimarina sp. 2208YS6-2-32]MDY8109166.1 disulfide bond formation protein B [Fulvimarina sp. 2208YS6-2-32]
MSPLSRATGFRQSAAAIALLIGTTLTVGSALLFQHVGGYIPCALCLEQRTPYYVAIPIALVAAIAAAGRARPVLVRGLLLVLGLVMLWSLYLGVFHAGVEWGYWPGPAECAGAAGGDLMGGDLLSTIDAVRAPSCDQAAARFFGLSFAGWNAVASAILASIALAAAFARSDRFATLEH